MPLVLEAIVSADTVDLVQAGLPGRRLPSALCLFATYAAAEVPVGTRFSRADDSPTHAVLLAVTQQFGKPLDGVPAGWKTICLIDFPHGVPANVSALPIAPAWGISPARIELA